MSSKSVTLTEYYSEFVDDLVASGKYKDASEVVREGLRLLERRSAEEDQKITLLRQLATEGFEQIDQGQGIALSSRQRLEAHIAKLGQQAAKTVEHRKNG